MGTTTMSLKKRSVHQPGDDNAPPYWTRKRTKMTKTTNHSIPLNRPESMPYLLPSQTRRNTMSLVLSLGRRKAKDQPPERDRLRQATFGPGSASAPTPPHLLLPLRQPPRENRRHLAQGGTRAPRATTRGRGRGSRGQRGQPTGWHTYFDYLK